MNPILWWMAQNTVVAAVLIVLVSLACVPLKNRPAWRHALWLLVLIKLITPPIISWPWSVAEFADASVSTPADADDAVAHAGRSTGPAEFIAETESTRVVRYTAAPSARFTPVETDGDIPSTIDDLSLSPSTDTDVSMESVAPSPKPTFKDASLATVQWSIIGLWIAGCAMALTVQFRRLVRVRSIINRGTSAPESLLYEIRKVSEKLNVSPVRATVVTDTKTPFLWCIGWLRLIWPQALISTAGLRQSRGIMAHELAHVRRRDHWVAWIELIAGILWWWNPLFWFVRRQLRESAEMACDAIALSIYDDRREYAEMFLKLSSCNVTEAPVPVLGISTGRPSSFERRFTMILSDRVSGKFSVWGCFLVACAATVVLPSLPWNSTLAQEKDSDEIHSTDAEEAKSYKQNEDVAQSPANIDHIAASSGDSTETVNPGESTAKPKNVGESSDDPWQPSNGSITYQVIRFSKVSDATTAWRFIKDKPDLSAKQLIAKLQGNEIDVASVTETQSLENLAVSDEFRELIKTKFRQHEDGHVVTDVSGSILLVRRLNTAEQQRPDRAEKQVQGTVWLSEYTPFAGKPDQGIGVVRVGGGKDVERSTVFNSCLSPAGLDWYRTIDNAKIAMLTGTDIKTFFKAGATDKAFAPQASQLYFVILPSADQHLNLADILTQRIPKGAIVQTPNAVKLFFYNGGDAETPDPVETDANRMRLQNWIEAGVSKMERDLLELDVRAASLKLESAKTKLGKIPANERDELETQIQLLEIEVQRADLKLRLHEHRSTTDR